MQEHLETERRASADFRRAHDEIQQRLEAERRASADIRRVHDELQAHLEAERQTTADLRRAHEETQARWDAERTASADVRQSATGVEERLQATTEELRDALAHSRAEVQTLRDDLEKARSRVETLFGERADAERSLKEAESRLKRTTRERDELAAERQTAREPDAAPAKTSPAATPLTVLPAPAYKVPHKGSAKAAAKAKEPEAGWVAVRMATRYGFREPIDVQVNGVSSQLCDLSVDGCQVLSATTLKPNQTVKVLLPATPKPIVCAGKIVWAKLEAPALGRSAGYRAGVQFGRVDESAVEAFIESQGAAPLG
jgi:myosin heavy subunit